MRRPLGTSRGRCVRHRRCQEPETGRVGARCRSSRDVQLSTAHPHLDVRLSENGDILLVFGLLDARTFLLPSSPVFQLSYGRIGRSGERSHAGRAGVNENADGAALAAPFIADLLADAGQKGAAASRNAPLGDAHRHDPGGGQSFMMRVELSFLTTVPAPLVEQSPQ